MWKRFDQRREFVWASALYLGSFVLQTQIHERYLYPVCVLALIAVLQERRMWLVALGVSLTFTFNMVNLAVPIVWLGLPLITGPEGELPTACLNILLLFEMLRVVISLQLLLRLSVLRGLRVFFKTPRLIAAGLLTLIYVASVSAGLSNIAISKWLTAHAADQLRIIVDSPVRYSAVLTNNQSQFEWQSVKDVTEKDSLVWMGEGFHYLVADLSADMPADQRVERLAKEPTTLLYDYRDRFLFGSHLAVYWTFRPDHAVNATFDDDLLFVGYNVLKSNGGIDLVFHWYTEQATSTAYSAFIHLVNVQTGQLTAQADYPLGGGSHPSSTWRQNELVFETIHLPTVNVPYKVEMGLYQGNTRAVIRNHEGNLIGDHLTILQIQDHY